MRLEDFLEIIRDIERLLEVERQAEKVVEQYEKGLLVPAPNSCSGLDVAILRDRLNGEFGDGRDDL